VLAAVLLTALACLAAPAVPAAADPSPADSSRARGDVLGLPLPEATATLQEQKISYSTDPPDLPAGTDPKNVIVLAERSTPSLARGGVVLVLGSLAPDLVGLAVSDAAALLTQDGLVAQREPADAPDTAVVRGQDVPATTSLALGQVVVVQAPPPPSSTGPSTAPGVVVPDVQGQALGPAREAISSAGLVISGTVTGHGTELTAVSQDPAAGATVQPGTLVHVAFLATVVGEQQDSTSRWVAGLAVTLALGLGAAVVVQLRRMRVDRQRTWARQHVRARLRARTVPTGRVREPDPESGPTVGLEPHLREGTRTLTELPR
jgi:hypothetical protein